MHDKDFTKKEYSVCAKWIKSRLEEDKDWKYIVTLGVSSEKIQERINELIDDEMWPEGMTVEDWQLFIVHYKSYHHKIDVSSTIDVIGIDEGQYVNTMPIPSGEASSWQAYKERLSKKISGLSVAETEKSCKWILNHLSLDTRKTGATKGLVTGSVQSGKTSNMVGLISMAADHDWNFFIILSGSIDNLRKQTRDRFREDLTDSEGIKWRVLDFTKEDKQTGEGELHLNSSSKKTSAWRYVTVCLKNRGRLEKVIDWLYEEPSRTRKLRVIVIDDEADQASINTAEITAEEEQERCAINQLIVNLVNGKKSDGSVPGTAVEAMNYISYTATPYANVLNEPPGESLYPKNYICTLEEAKEYFGAKVLFGNNEEDAPGLGVCRDIDFEQEARLKEVHNLERVLPPDSLKKAVGWFLCCSAILRHQGKLEPISMLIHTSATLKHHFAVYDSIQNWLKKKDDVIEWCKKVYEDERDAVSVDDLKLANPEYPILGKVSNITLEFDEIQGGIRELLAAVSNILLEDDKTPSYGGGIHLCVDNCKANREAEEGTQLRIVYPNKEQLKEMQKAPIFIVIGGNTLSRGLTIEGLVCTYFARNSNQADTLMQMARWFGYRRGYELLQRIWMTDIALRKYMALAKIESDLKKEVERFMERGISPAEFGPRIRNVPEIAKFLITARKKSQSAELSDFDFTGDSYETTDFDDDTKLLENVDRTDSFLMELESQYSVKESTTANGWVWTGVESSRVIQYLEKYQISQHSSLYINLPIFITWMKEMNNGGKYLRWNITAISGDKNSAKWKIGSDKELYTVERTKKAKKTHIDIGSLRSGRDALSDIFEEELTPEQKDAFKNTRKNGKDIIQRRCLLGAEDIPLLLIYRIRKDGGEPKGASREIMNAIEDIIGIAIIVSGESIGESHARSIRIKLSNERAE